VKKSLENIYKVQKNPALETTLIETDKVVRQNIARVCLLSKLEISAPSPSTLDTIETKLTEAQFSHNFSDDDPSTPAPLTPSKQPRCPTVKSESSLEQQGKKLKPLNSRPAHEGINRFAQVSVLSTHFLQELGKQDPEIDYLKENNKNLQGQVQSLAGTVQRLEGVVESLQSQLGE
jgi:hypothetical protein